MDGPEVALNTVDPALEKNAKFNLSHGNSNERIHKASSDSRNHNFDNQQSINQSYYTTNNGGCKSNDITSRSSPGRDSREFLAHSPSRNIRVSPVGHERSPSSSQRSPIADTATGRRNHLSDTRDSTDGPQKSSADHAYSCTERPNAGGSINYSPSAHNHGTPTLRRPSNIANIEKSSAVCVRGSQKTPLNSTSSVTSNTSLSPSASVNKEQLSPVTDAQRTLRAHENKEILNAGSVYLNLPRISRSESDEVHCVNRHLAGDVLGSTRSLTHNSPRHQKIRTSTGVRRSSCIAFSNTSSSPTFRSLANANKVPSGLSLPNSISPTANALVVQNFSGTFDACPKRKTSSPSRLTDITQYLPPPTLPKVDQSQSKHLSRRRGCGDPSCPLRRPQGRLYRSVSLPATSAVWGVVRPNTCDGRRASWSTLLRHYYPEGGWGWVVLGMATATSLLTHGLHTSYGAILSPLAYRFHIKVPLAASVLLGVALAAVPRVRRDSTPDFYELPSNASVVLGGINYGFDCTGRNFGYYADLSNNCQIFHICMPYEDAEGFPQMRMWSFLCGIGTMFDQAQLVCNYPEDSLPCAEAESSYNINDYFHREDLEFRGGEFNGLA